MGLHDVTEWFAHGMLCNGMDYAWAYMALRNGLGIKGSLTEWIMPGLTWCYGID